MRIGSLVLAITALLSGAAISSSHATGVDIGISSEYDDPGFLVVTPQSCRARQPGLCSFSGSGIATFTGTLNGFTEYHALGSFDPVNGTATFEVWETFTGMLVGCGHGSVRWYLSGTAEMRDFDPVTMTMPLNATWQLLADSGTGHLAHIAGSGIAQGPINPFTRENHGTFTGSITCVGKG